MIYQKQHNPLLFNYAAKLRSMTRLIISTSALLFIILYVYAILLVLLTFVEDFPNIFCWNPQIHKELLP